MSRSLGHWKREATHALNWLGLAPELNMYILKSSHYLHLGDNASELRRLGQKHLCSPWAYACPLWVVVCFGRKSDACFSSSRATAYGIRFLKALPIFTFYICDSFILWKVCILSFFSPPSWFVWVWAVRAGRRVINFQASWCHRCQAWILRRVLLVAKTVNYSVLTPPKPFQGIASMRNMLASHF